MIKVNDRYEKISQINSRKNRKKVKKIEKSSKKKGKKCRKLSVESFRNSVYNKEFLHKKPKGKEIFFKRFFSGKIEKKIRE